jgi:ABC-type xylose transport system permease subunit
MSKLHRVKKRWDAKTPKFFKKIIKLGVGVGVVGGVIATLPVSLPAAIVTLGGYMVATGTVTAAVAKLTVEDITEIK